MNKRNKYKFHIMSGNEERRGMVKKRLLPIKVCVEDKIDNTGLEKGRKRQACIQHDYVTTKINIHEEDNNQEQNI